MSERTVSQKMFEFVNYHQLLSSYTANRDFMSLKKVILTDPCIPSHKEFEKIIQQYIQLQIHQIYLREVRSTFFKKNFYVSPIPNFLLICFPSSTCTDSVLRVSHKFPYTYINCYIQIYVIRLSLISKYFYRFLIYGKFQYEY